MLIKIERNIYKMTIEHNFITDENENPAGGTSTAAGISIEWQNGPMTTPEDQNGAFVIDVIQIAIDRINFYNDSKFRCRENSLAVTKLEEAIHWLESRRTRRAQEGILGSHDTSGSEG